MPHRLAHTEASVPPDDAQIFIVSGEPDPPCFGWEERRFLYCARDVVVLQSGSQWLHEARVRLEAWDSYPPQPDGNWGEAQGGRLQLSDETVAVQALYEIDLSDRIPVGEPGWYEVRAYVTGREELTRWEREWNGESDHPVGLEQFLVQLWPA